MADRVPGPAQRGMRHCQLDDPPGRQHLSDRVTGHERHAQAGQRARHHRPVGTQRERGRVGVELGQQRLARRPGSRAGLPQQPGRTHRVRYPGRAHHHQLIAADRPHGHVQRPRGAPGYDQVGLVGREQPPHALPVAHLQPEVDARMALAQRRDQYRHDVLACRGHRRDPHPGVLGVGGASRGGQPLFLQAEDLARVPGEDAAGPGQPEPPPVPFEQRHADLASERGERSRDRRLGDHEPRGGSPHRPGVGHRHVRPQSPRGRHVHHSTVEEKLVVIA